LVANDTAENRAKNRRVEIIITQQRPRIGFKSDDLAGSLDNIDSLLQTDAVARKFE